MNNLNSNHLEASSFSWQSFSPKQQHTIFFFCRAENKNQYAGIIDYGAVRSGKTIAGIIAFLLHSQTFPPGTKHLISGKTAGTIRNNVLKTFFDLFGSKECNYNYQRQELTIEGQIYRCLGADKINSQDVLQGDTIADWYADEITKHHQNFVDQAFARMSVQGAKFFWNCNPESPYHFVKTKYIDRAEQLDIYVKKWSIHDNLTLSTDYKKRLEKSLSGIFYKRNILGLWVNSEGLIYPDFIEQIHWIHDEQVPKDLNYYVVGIDYGITNPQVYGLIGYKLIDGKPYEYVLKEYYWDSRKTNTYKTDIEYAYDLQKFIEGITIKHNIIDPSASSFVHQLRKLDIQNIRKANNNVLEGIRNHSNWLNEGRIYVVKEKCPCLIKEYASYMWNPRAQEKGKDEPLKTNDHAMDAICRYPKQTLYPFRSHIKIVRSKNLPYNE